MLENIMGVQPAAECVDTVYEEICWFGFCSLGGGHYTTDKLVWRRYDRNTLKQCGTGTIKCGC
ncbi:hypothetical protein P4S95_09545 [Aneurinibacillus aneurinilyticus]|uniref:hypothetical protein n=1 Tax=Aneurinibacillus aneurinilyticus TaxID=1391 RepID=UPI002E24454B|nr:hypothetical protein [Aneurinibacillus aneurinilyticus]